MGPVGAGGNRIPRLNRGGCDNFSELLHSCHSTLSPVCSGSVENGPHDFSTRNPGKGATQSAEEQVSPELRGGALTRAVVFEASLRLFEKAMLSDSVRSGVQAAGLAVQCQLTDGIPIRPE
jgi:hypothetical protein